jgi:hypothetical protein
MNERLEQIKYLLKFLTELRTTQKTSIVGSDAILFKKVYFDIYRVNPNLGCGSCVMHSLAMMEAYYQREYKEPVPEVIPEAIPDPIQPLKAENDITPAKAAKPVKKAKKK